MSNGGILKPDTNLFIFYGGRLAEVEVNCDLKGHLKVVSEASNISIGKTPRLADWELQPENLFY